MKICLARRASVTAALLLCALMPAAAAAQTDINSPAALYIEYGGNGLVYSLNYEGRISDHFAGRVGFTFLNMTVLSEETGEESEVAVTLMPVMGNMLLGRGSARLELGAGPLIGVKGTGVDRVERGSASVELKRDLSVAGVTSTVGLRYQPPRTAILLRATVTPFYSGKAQVWGGFSLGWTM